MTPELLLRLSHAELLAAAQAQAKRIAALEREQDELIEEFNRLAEDRLVMALEVQAEGDRRRNRALRWAWTYRRTLAAAYRWLVTADKGRNEAQARLALLRRAPVQRDGAYVLVAGAAWDAAMGVHAPVVHASGLSEPVRGGDGTISRSSDSRTSDAEVSDV